MDKLTLAKEIYQISNIKGDFTLRSQQQTTEYFDKYLFAAQPKLLFEIACQLVALVPENIDTLAGLEMGGILIATALSLQTGIPLVFVRKKAKTYGTCKLAEGGEVKSKRILIVEDVVTSGGAIIEQAVCVIDRESLGAENLKKIGVKLMPLFTKSYLQSSSC